MTQRYHTYDEVVQALRQATEHHPRGGKGWCTDNKIDRATVSMALRGRRRLTETMARRVGFASVTLFVRTDEAASIDIRSLRPIEQATMRAELEAARKETEKAQRIAAGLNEIIRRAAEVLAREPLRKHNRKGIT